jgi:hypothetical protein
MHHACDTGRTRADTPPNPSRRAMLAGGTAALLAGAAAATVAHGAPPGVAGADGPDAELIALCAAFHRQNAAVTTVADGGSYAGGDEADLDDAMAERWDLSDRIQDMPTTTLAGHRAKASVAVVLLRENNGSDEFMSGDDAFAFATLLDIAGSAAA